MKKIILFIVITILSLWNHVYAYEAYTDLPSFVRDNCGTYSTSGWKKTIFDVIWDVSLNEITKFGYCSCSLRISNSSDYPKNEEEIMWKDEDDPKWVSCVSNVETTILLLKKEKINSEDSTSNWTGTSFWNSKKNLNFDNSKRLAENMAWLDCGWLESWISDNDIVWCVKDLRLYEHNLRKNSSWFFWTPFIAIKVWWAGGLNWVIGWVDQFISYLSFWFKQFDSLPPLWYGPQDTFNKSTIVWWINSMALMLLAIFVLYKFFLRSLWREGESYFVFFAKFWIVLLVTIWFPSIYGWLEHINQSMWSVIVESLNQSWVSGITEASISLDKFWNGWFNHLSTWTFIVGIINIPLLLVISLIIVARNLVLFMMSYVFFVFAIFLMMGSLMKHNIFEGTKTSDKILAFWSKSLFWALSMFISVIISIFLFKIWILILGSIPGIEGNWRSIIENIGWFGISTLLYLWYLLWILIITVKYIHPAVTSFVDGIFTNIFLSADGAFTSKDFIWKFSEYSSKTKDWYQKTMHTDPNAMRIERYMSSKIQPVAQTIADSSLLANIWSGKTGKALSFAKWVVETSARMATWEGSVWTFSRWGLKIAGVEIQKWRDTKKKQLLEEKIEESKNQEWQWLYRSYLQWEVEKIDINESIRKSENKISTSDSQIKRVRKNTEKTEKQLDKAIQEGDHGKIYNHWLEVEKWMTQIERLKTEKTAEDIHITWEKKKISVGSIEHSIKRLQFLAENTPDEIKKWEILAEIQTKTTELWNTKETSEVIQREKIEIGKNIEAIKEKETSIYTKFENINLLRKRESELVQWIQWEKLKRAKTIGISKETRDKRMFIDSNITNMDTELGKIRESIQKLHSAPINSGIDILKSYLPTDIDLDKLSERRNESEMDFLTRFAMWKSNENINESSLDVFDGNPIFTQIKANIILEWWDISTIENLISNKFNDLCIV